MYIGTCCSDRLSPLANMNQGNNFQTRPDTDNEFFSHFKHRLDFSPNGGGQNIGPPPQAQGRHGEMLDRGHIAPQGTPSQVQGQSAFRQAWHQGQESRALGRSTARWTLPSLNIVHIPVMLMLDLNPQGIGMGATGNSYRKRVESPCYGDPNQM
ncbi:unnamed protein product [Mytilus edulis]|uniref:Uncharacterized protein n=1 Tax=Mytilus edulis TaxID=6550 RepID=A0A8S3VD77_MYTED|nr:unnamed protein product [Mytilus edulis]